ncbi:phosphate-starvation-inducible PsiE family protein [Desulfobaculum sp.]
MYFHNDDAEHSASESAMIHRLWTVIRGCVKALAVLMTAVIFWGMLDVIWVLYERMTTPPMLLLNINDILATFGAFMAVLIAIEIFANIIVYLESEMIHLKLVLSTALMAAARKVIVLDFSVNTFLEVFSLAGVILALSVGYWLICHRSKCLLMSSMSNTEESAAVCPLFPRNGEKNEGHDGAEKAKEHASAPTPPEKGEA